HEEQPTHMGVDTTHPHDPPTHMGVPPTPIEAGTTHTRVVVFKDLHTNYNAPHMGVDTTHPHDPPTHIGVGNIDSDVSEDAIPSPAPSAQVSIHDALTASQVRAQLGRKARQVLGYLNSIRSLERRAYTVPVGYAQISAAADVHVHYLRRDV